jgi:cholesterol transport system auxiliary component
MVRMGAFGALMMAALLLGGCALGGLMNHAAPPLTYDLEAPDVTHKTGRAHGANIAIAPPAAVRTIDTEEILVKTPDGRVSYFPGSAWGDRLPRLVQARLVETFANSGVFKAVITSQDRVSPDLSLSLEIRDFQVNMRDGHAEASIDIYAKLVSERNGSVIASKRFTATAPAVKDDAGSGVMALNEAFQRVAADMLAWTVSQRGQA